MRRPSVLLAISAACALSGCVSNDVGPSRITATPAKLQGACASAMAEAAARTGDAHRGAWHVNFSPVATSTRSHTLGRLVPAVERRPGEWVCGSTSGSKRTQGSIIYTTPSGAYPREVLVHEAAEALGIANGKHAHSAYTGKGIFGL